MDHLTPWVRGFVRDEEGATAIEYALMAALAAIIAIGAMTLFGQNSVAMWTNVANTIATAIG